MSGKFQPQPPAKGPQVFILATDGNGGQWSWNVTPLPGDRRLVSFRAAMSPENALTIDNLIVTEE